MVFQKIEGKDQGDLHDWEKEPVLIGRLVQRETGVGMNKSNVYTILKEDGEQDKFWGTTVLDGRLSNIQPNELIKVAFMGYATGGSGKRFKNFEVFIDVPEGEDIPAAPLMTEEKINANMEEVKPEDINLDEIPF